MPLQASDRTKRKAGQSLLQARHGLTFLIAPRALRHPNFQGLHLFHVRHGLLAVRDGPVLHLRIELRRIQEVRAQTLLEFLFKHVPRTACQTVQE